MATTYLKEATVLLVDDHKLFLDGIRFLLDQESDIHVAGTAADGKSALEFLEKMPVDIVLADMEMPRMNGLELLQAIKKNFPQTDVVFISMKKHPTLVKEAIHLGASGYVLKDASQVELMIAVRSVLRGDQYLSQGVGDILREEEPENLIEHSPRDILTDREQEILRLIAKQYSNNQIADTLQISRRTVETHRKNIMRKVGVKNSVGLAHYAFAHGLTL